MFQQLSAGKSWSTDVVLGSAGNIYIRYPKVLVLFSADERLPLTLVTPCSRQSDKITVKMIWPRGLRRGSAAARWPKLQVRIPP